jgi:hypothetical protein
MFIEILSVGTQFFHAGRDGRKNMMVIVAFRTFSNATTSTH